MEVKIYIVVEFFFLNYYLKDVFMILYFKKKLDIILGCK